ncbi:MAG: hypothetical protein R3320_06665, partial [Nitriliruptorales bacterium]|nr:hypothetical protein [Nitriliruptorales bacterium]
MTTSTSWTRRIGIALMAASLALATVLGMAGPVGAEETSGTPEEAQEAKTTKHGFYDAPLLNVIPPSVLQQFPPQVVCLVVVQACTGNLNENQPDESRDGYVAVTGGIQEGMDTAEANDPHEPRSPHVPENTLPVAITTGQARYHSAVAFELPSVPSGHQVDSFKLYLTETNPTGGVSSPVARQAILAAMTCARECQNDQFEKILFMGCDGGRTDSPGTCPAEQEPLRVEMCAIADNPSTDEKNAEWKGERSQDPDNIPEADCLLGANGKRLEDGSWEFDMTYAMDAWANGEIANNGVLLVPGGAPNFAFGDPDSTFNKQVTFENAIKYTIATSEEPEPVSFGSFGGSSSGFDSGSSSTTSTSSSPSNGFSSAPSGGSSGNVSSFSAPANDGAPAEPAPEVAGGAP